MTASRTWLILTLHGAGLRSSYLQVASLSSVGLCIGLWIRAKTVDQDERGNAERRALFVGLWPPTLWLIGESVQKNRSKCGSGCSARSTRAPRWAACAAAG